MRRIHLVVPCVSEDPNCIQDGCKDVQGAAVAHLAGVDGVQHLRGAHDQRHGAVRHARQRRRLQPARHTWDMWQFRRDLTSVPQVTRHQPECPHCAGDCVCDYTC